jgi:4-hydroxybenzoate polyprenyltransferase
VFYNFTSELNLFFLLFLAGQTLTVYGLIIPTEIRDYFGDKAMNVETMTVRLGLVKASFFGMVLLSAGGILSGAAFFLALALNFNQC